MTATWRRRCARPFGGHPSVAKLRGDVLALRTVLERNAVVLDDGGGRGCAFRAFVSDDPTLPFTFYVGGGAFEERAAGSSSASTAQTTSPSCRASSSRCTVCFTGRGRASMKVAAVSVDDVAHTPTSAIPREVPGLCRARGSGDDCELVGADGVVRPCSSTPKRGPKAQPWRRSRRTPGKPRPVSHEACG